MTVPNPTAPPEPQRLPMIEVRGATSRRRHALVVLTALIPAAVAMVPTFAAPFDAPIWTIATEFVGPVCAALIWLVIAVRSWPPLAGISRHVTATCIGLGWSGAAAVVALVGAASAAWDVGRVAIVVGAGVVGFWLSWWVAGIRLGVVGPIVVPAAAPAAPATRTAWSGVAVHGVNIGLWLSLAAMYVVFFVLAWPADDPQVWTLVVVLAAIAGAIPAAVRVSVDRRGLQVRALAFGIPLVRVPLDRVAAAAAGIVEEGQWGNGAAVADRELVSIVHRSGPALVVTRTDGSMVVVAVPRADEAAAVLETLRAQAARARG